MKRQFLLLLAIAVFATALTTNASAQTTKTLRANVKFDFQIGDRIYPAGNALKNIATNAGGISIGEVRYVVFVHFIWTRTALAKRVSVVTGDDRLC